MARDSDSWAGRAVGAAAVVGGLALLSLQDLTGLRSGRAMSFGAFLVVVGVGQVLNGRLLWGPLENSRPWFIAGAIAGVAVALLRLL